MKAHIRYLCFVTGLLLSCVAYAANSVPTDVQLPGTQPQETNSLESPNKCDNCHGGYNSAVEPAHNWRGSMMAHAGRDPIFWATVAVAEQNFDGVGDLCIRCHSTGGWLAGRSTPTDGSGLAAGDSDGVECDYCHKLTNPDDSGAPLVGVMNTPFEANEPNPGDVDGVEGYYGSGMSSMWGGSDKLGPYNDAEARHQFMQSEFHRDPDFCGTCHDVSNPVTGDLAHNHGQGFLPDGALPGFSGIPGSPVGGKAAFNNPPYAYGIVERTFSEYKSGLISQTRVQDYGSLPEDLQGGVLAAVYEAATNGGPPESANYQNPTATRYFSCQTCHMRPVTGKGANKRGVPTRTDLPLHDMTGGNYWMPSVIQYLNGLGKLRLGGDMSQALIDAMNDGAARALEQLQLAASLEIENEADYLEVEVINHTGHKLISGYPEGRRMWLNIKWYNAADQLIREDGEYGDLEVNFQGNPLTVRTILDLEDPNTKIYEAHMGMTGQWAGQLLELGFDSGLPLMFDRETGLVEFTLGDLAAQNPETNPVHESFHFALNNVVISDNRIPPYRMNFAEAQRRNALPVPDSQYGCDQGCVEYEYYDEVEITKPVTDTAVRATVELMYQPTNWEYIQFLALANDGSSAFLGEEGDIMLDAWLNNGMAEPVVMASAAWGSVPEPCPVHAPVIDEVIAGDKQNTINWFADGSANAYSVYFDQSGKAQFIDHSSCNSGPCSYTHTGLTNGQEYCYMMTATNSCESEFSDISCATPQPPGHQQLAGVASIETGTVVKSGKGKNATFVFTPGSSFAPGDKVVFRGMVTDDTGVSLSGAMFSLDITGPESAGINSPASDDQGYADAEWSTQRPNRKGAGGTAEGVYTATVSGLSAGGFDWDNVPLAVEFTIGGQ